MTVRTAVPRWFADTEEVTGSNPVAPTIYSCSSGRVFAPGLLHWESLTGSSGSKRAATASEPAGRPGATGRPMRRAAAARPQLAGH
jgi:hypothetical protein